MSGDRLADFVRRDGGKVTIRPRRPKRNTGFDVEHVRQEMANRPDNFLNYDADLREVMERLVDGHISSTLGSCIKKVIQEYPELATPSTDSNQFGYVLATMFPTYAKASEITALSHVLVAKGVEAYYSEGEIANYMCNAVNKHLHKYGIHVRLESKDVVLYVTQKVSRQKALELVESIET
jgi:hypothetical protein